MPAADGGGTAASWRRRSLRPSPLGRWRRASSSPARRCLGTVPCACAAAVLLCHWLQAAELLFLPAAGAAQKSVLRTRLRSDTAATAAAAPSLLAVPLAASAAEAMLPPAPSGVNTLPELEQAGIVLAIFAALAVLTQALIGPGFRFLRDALPEGWFSTWQKTWPILGAFYMAAGSAHFTAAEAFESIYPPLGTWGFWYLPGSASFHVAWTGVAELAGGAGLFVGSILLAASRFFSGNDRAPEILQWIVAASALGLFALTWVVTPANIYMYTHGAQMIGLTPGDAAIPVQGHFLRGVLQVVLLSILWGCYEDAKPVKE